MTSTATSPRGFHCISLAAFLCGAAPVFAQASLPSETEDLHTVRLDPVVVSATRTAQDPLYVPNAVTSLDPLAFRPAQIFSLADALASAPGVNISHTGAAGGQTSVFMRGAASHQTLFVVDGIRMNDRVTPYYNLLGAAGLAGFDRVEVLRGPQSTLYGSSAVGGIILLDTTHGCGAATGAFRALAGSDSTWGGSAEVSGGTKISGYSAHIDRFETDNERDWNHYRNWSGSTRLEYTAAPNVVVGVTARAVEGTYQEPGSRFWASHGTVDDDNLLTTAYAQLRSEEGFSSRLTVGQASRHYAYADTWGTTHLRNRRRVLDWQASWSPSSKLEVLGGTNWETSRYLVSGVPTSDRVEAAFASVIVRPVDKWVLTGGLRYDNYSTFSSATTGRGGVTYLPVKGTKLRATYGTGFIAPGVDDRFGVPAWGQRPSPGLRAERAKGWDVGIDQTLPALASTASISYFDTRIRNLFEWQYVDFVTYEGRIVNRARATLRGTEVALASKLPGSVGTRLSYTHLEAKDGDSGARLARRPRHVLDAQVDWTGIRRFSIGAGARLVADRFDLASRQPSFATFRVFARWDATATLHLLARVENALDRSYEDVVGYAALGRQAFGGIEWTF